MKTEREDREWIDRIKSHLDQQTEQLDAGVLSRLTRARHRALEAGRGSAAGWPWKHWMPLPVAGLAAAATVLLALALTLGTPETGSNGTPLEDLDLLASADQLELYENLEFYAWLAESSGNDYETG